MLIKTLLTTTLLLFCSFVSAQQMNINIEDLIKHNLPNADIGVMVRDAESGEILYQHNGYQSFSPASNIKLFTAAAALYKLGPGYRYETLVAYDKHLLNHHKLNSNIYLKFSGDPSLRIQDLQELIHLLNKTGMQSIDGNIVIDSTRFTGPNHPAGISYDDLIWGYAAPVSGIILNENEFAYLLKSPKKLGALIDIAPLEDSHWLHIESDVHLVALQTANEHCAFHGEQLPGNNVHLEGCWPLLNKPKTVKFSVPYPFLMAKQVIAETLLKDHIRLTGKIIPGSYPRNLQPIRIHHSKPLLILVKHLLLQSDNLFADSILKTLGAEVLNEGNFTQGVFVLKSILSEHTNLDVSKLKIADGSGTRYNLASPYQVTQLLFSTYHDKKLSKVFRDSLPKAGKTGTLKNRLQAFNTENSVHAKTGTMHDTSALAGYLTTYSGTKVIFSIINNHVIGKVAPAKQLENMIVDAVIQSV